VPVVVAWSIDVSVGSDEEKDWMFGGWVIITFFPFYVIVI